MKLQKIRLCLQDRETASKLSNKCDKEKLYRELASTAESGWDFSTRWMRYYIYIHKLEFNLPLLQLNT